MKPRDLLSTTSQCSISVLFLFALCFPNLTLAGACEDACGVVNICLPLPTVGFEPPAGQSPQPEAGFLYKVRASKVPCPNPKGPFQPITKAELNTHYGRRDQRAEGTTLTNEFSTHPLSTIVEMVFGAPTTAQIDVDGDTLTFCGVYYKIPVKNFGDLSSMTSATPPSGWPNAPFDDPSSSTQQNVANRLCAQIQDGGAAANNDIPLGAAANQCSVTTGPQDCSKRLKKCRWAATRPIPGANKTCTIIGGSVCKDMYIDCYLTDTCGTTPPPPIERLPRIDPDNLHSAVSTETPEDDFIAE
ncbi:MAG: hypothetical protein KDD70_08415 [Bdellovibrionales bacterium]|nr:hypothetical protein [Bdellovibrionales bacterium]